MRGDEGFPPGMAYMDGRFCSLSEARIPILDWGFLRSDATYDVVHVWKGRFFRLDAHIERFLSGTAKLRMSLPVGGDELADILKQCVRRSGLEDAYVEMVLTRGVSPSFSRDPRDAVNRFMAFAIPFGWIASEEQRARGLDLHVSGISRIPPGSVDPTVKNYHWLDLVMGMFEAYDAGRETAVLTDGAGNVCEGPGFNLFVAKGGKVTTPASGILEGITRRTVLELCTELQIPASPEIVPVHALADADEIFVSSTAGGVMPIGRLEGSPVGTQVPGPLTARITELYWQKHTDPEWSTPVD